MILYTRGMYFLYLKKNVYFHKISFSLMVENKTESNINTSLRGSRATLLTCKTMANFMDNFMISNIIIFRNRVDVECRAKGSFLAIF